MKKYLLITLGAMLLTTLAQAKDLPELSNAVERAVATQVMPFVNERVRQMCTEWPNCLAWAQQQYREDATFKILDAEIERYIAIFSFKEEVWGHRFHVQVSKQDKLIPYVFKEVKINGKYQYLPPVLSKKFPGHPIAGKPSQHAKYKIDNHATDGMKARWPIVEYWGNVKRVVETQYVKGFDKDGNALWGRTMYVTFIIYGPPPMKHQNTYLIRAYQTKANGPYTYTKEKEIYYYPEFPSFSFKAK